MANAAKHQQTPEVRLDDGDYRSIHNSGQTQGHENSDHRGVLRGIREQRKRKTKEAICTQFNPGQHDRHRDRPLNQGIGQPGMKWKYGRFKGQAQKYQPKNQQLLTERNLNSKQVE